MRTLKDNYKLIKSFERWANRPENGFTKAEIEREIRQDIMCLIHISEEDREKLLDFFMV